MAGYRYDAKGTTVHQQLIINSAADSASLPRKKSKKLPLNDSDSDDSDTDEHTVPTVAIAICT